ncbi:MAG: ABC transporter permease, partial [Halorhodospira halophila]
AYLLLGEQAVLIAAALPIGFVIGHYLYAIIVQAAESELYRVPMIPSVAGIALATLVLLGVAALSAWVVRRRLDRLDMVEALKSRE